MQPFFITGAGTGIGKTLVTTTLIWQLRQMGKKVTALKPIISGFDVKDADSDAALILHSAGLTLTPESLATVSPWRFKAPLSPDMAAAKEGTKIDFDALLACCRGHEASQQDFLLVEGVGGVMVPLDGVHTVLDWMQALGWPVILVGGTYLGALSHTLTSLEVLRARGLKVRALVISQSPEPQVGLDDTLRALEAFMPPHVPLVKIPRMGISSELWKTMPLISWICHERTI